MNQDKDRFIPLDLYRSIIEYIPIASVDVLFLNDKRTKTLLFRRNNHPLKRVYFSIGGRLLKNEKIIDGARRQARQEVGLDLNPADLVFGGVQDEICDQSVFSNNNQHNVDIFFGYTIDQEEIILDSQHSDYKWFSVTDDSLHPWIKSKLAKLIKK